MPSIIVPQQQAENPVGDGSSRAFPSGDWNFVIEEVRVRAFPDFIDPVKRPKAGYASTDGEITSVQLGQATPLGEGQENPGAQKHFVDFVTRDGSETPDTIDLGDRNSKSWQLQRSTKMLANLAIALGATETVEDEDGNRMTVVAENFLDELKAGAFNDRAVAASVYHRPWSKKDAQGTVVKEGVNVETRGFAQAV